MSGIKTPIISVVIGEGGSGGALGLGVADKGIYAWKLCLFCNFTRRMCSNIV